MRPLAASIAAVMVAMLWSGWCPAAPWAQLQCTPQRAGYTDDSPAPPYAVRWVVSLWPQTIAHNVQAVSDGERAYVGTKAGYMHALRLSDGSEAWRHQADGAIVHTAAVADGAVYFATLNGAVHCVDAASGQPRWTFRAGDDLVESAGISTAVLVAEGKVFVCNRGGLVLAIAANSGKELWRYETGARIFNSPAYDRMEGEQFGRVIVGGEDMHVYCLDSRSGALLWKSPKLGGSSMKDYHPVVAEGRVIIRTLFSTVRAGLQTQAISGDFIKSMDGLIAEHRQLLASENPGRDLLRMPIRASAADVAVQDRIAAWLGENPIYRDIFVLDMRTGQEAYVPCILFGYCNNGVVPPPVVDKAGNVYTTTQMVTARTVNKGGGGPPKTVRIDIRTGRVVEWYGFALYMNSDETTNLSLGGSRLFEIHHQGWTSGVLDLGTGRAAGDLPGPDAWSLPYVGNMMSGGNSGCITGKLILHNRHSHIVAFEGR